MGRDIVKKESPLALYKGLGAVVTGIVPKMAIRFSSFEAYKKYLANKETGRVSTGATFIAGLGAGVTEAVAVVSPMECIKIRLQAQHHSMADPLDVPRYRNAAHAAYTIVREEGFSTLYRGVTLTAARQATNQAVNFTAYQEFQKWAKEYQNIGKDSQLPSWQNFALGGISGAMGPMSNSPIDIIKTRIQRGAAPDGQKGLQRIMTITRDLIAKEGVRAFYKGLTPRVLRVAPGQACCPGSLVCTVNKVGCHFCRIRKGQDLVGGRRSGQFGQLDPSGLAFRVKKESIFLHFRRFGEVSFSCLQRKSLDRKLTFPLYICT